MSPREVHSLQQLAESKGGSLTVNPHTGLVEAKFFEELGKVAEKAAPYVAAYYLGPEVAGTFGVSEAVGAGIAAGGTSFAMTGSLQKGLQTGLGVYGLAGLGEAAMSGINNASSAAGQKIAADSAAAGLDAGGAEMTKAMTAAQEAGVNQTIGDKIKAGAKGIAALGPRDLLKYGSAAAVPIISSLASEASKKTGSMPTSSASPGYIRQYYFDPKSQSVKPLEPVRTQDWGNTTFESRVPYIPKSADGGLQSSYAMGGVTDDGTAHFDNGGLTADIAKELMQRSMTTGVPNSEIAKYGGYDAIKSMYDAGGGQYGLSSIAPADLQKYANTIANTGVGNLSALTQAGIAMTPAGIANMQANGTSGSPVGGGSSSGLTADIARDIMQRSMTTGVSNSEIAKYGGYAAIKAMYDAGGGKYSLESINPADLQKYANTIANTGVGNLSALTQAGVPLTAAGLENMRKNGINPNDYLSYLKNTTSPTSPTVVSNPYGNKTTPGDVTRNSDGTLTVTPNIPNRPYGGTTGMGKLTSDYALGGGQLGQVLSPSKAYENTGASADIYKYLMGKGDYPIQETGIGKNSRYYNGVEPTTSNPNNKLRVNPQTRMIEPNTDYVAPAANGGLMQAYADGGTTSQNPYDFLEYKKGTGNPNAAANQAAAFDAMTPAQKADHQAQLAAINEGLTPMLVKILKAIKDKILFKDKNEPLAEEVDMSIMSPDAIAQQDAAITLALADSAENTPTVTNNPAALMGDTSGDGGGAVSSGGVSGDSGSPMGGIASTGTVGQAVAANNAIAAAIANAANGSTGSGTGSVGGNTGTGNGGTTSGQGTGIGIGAANGMGLAHGGLMEAMARGGSTHQPFFSRSTGKFNSTGPKIYANGGISVGSRPDPNIDGQYQPYPNVSFQPTVGRFAAGGEAGYNLGSYSDGGRLLRGPGDGVSDSIPATIGRGQPARLADGEFVVPARIVSELGNGSTEAGARKLYAMMDRIQAARSKTIGKGKIAKNSRADKYLPK
jgi:hypothetical protein